MRQNEFFGNGSIKRIEGILKEEGAKKIFLVTGKDIYALTGAEKELKPVFEDYSLTFFTDFSPNPDLKEIEAGMELFRKGHDLVIAIGGGSSIDMAKAINILSAQEGSPVEFIEKKKEISERGAPLIAVPTTTGSGSEATRFAVVYVGGKKHSLENDLLLPSYSIIDPVLSMSMPKSVAAATSMDAICQAIESYWSVNSTDESKAYSREAIKLALANARGSVKNASLEARGAMARAANLAGKAINISKTTAPHALSYDIVARFGLQHGHAVALALGGALEYNSGVTEKDCNDRRGAAYVKKTIGEICSLLGCSGPSEAKDLIRKLAADLGLEIGLEKLGIGGKDIAQIAENVNLERLKNNPRNFPSKKSLVSVFR